MGGKSVLITGAARGIGFEIARAFGGHGARLVLNDRSDEALQAAVRRLEAEGLLAIAAPGDVTDEDVCGRIVTLAAESGGLDVLVNNAATGRSAAVKDHTVDYWHRVLAVNLIAPFLLVKSAHGALAKAGGSVVNIASAAAFGMRGQCSYDASKGGLISLTRSLAVELGEAGVRVNAVCPGFVDTEMIKASPGLLEQAAAVTRTAPLARLAQPEEIAEAVLWLASEEASYVTGHTLFVDGGWIRL